MKQIGKYIGLFIILGILPIALMAQSATSLIVGKVVDEGRMPLPYASVSIYRSGKNLLASVILSPRLCFSTSS